MERFGRLAGVVELVLGKKNLADLCVVLLVSGKVVLLGICAVGWRAEVKQ